MRKFYLFIGLLSLALCSCEEYFDVHVEKIEPKMFVQCYAGATDTTFIHLYRANPVGAKPVPAEKFTLGSLSVYANGSPVTFKSDDGLLWYTLTKFQSGSEIDLSVQTEEYHELKAHSSVPEQPSFSVSYEQKQQLSFMPVDYVDFKVKLAGTLREDDRYGVIVNKKVVTDHGDSLGRAELITIDMESGLIAGLNAGGIHTASYQSSYDHNTLLDMMIFKGEDIKDGTISFCVLLEYDLSNWPEEGFPEDDFGGLIGGFEPGDGDEPEIEYPEPELEDARFQIEVYRLSDEAYNYMNAKYNQENNILSSLGLCPPDYAYSNVSGGYGIFAGAAMKASEWIDPEL